MEPIEYFPGFFMHDCCVRLLVFYIFLDCLGKGLIRIIRTVFVKKSDSDCDEYIDNPCEFD